MSFSDYSSRNGCTVFSKLASLLISTLLHFPMAALAQADLGVIGDTHGEVDAALKAAADARQSGAKYIVLAGDMVGFRDDDPLYGPWKRGEVPAEQAPAVRKALQDKAHKQLLDLFEGLNKLGYSQNEIFAVPGNWEKTWAPKAGSIFEEHAIAVTHSFDGKGIARIGDKKVMVSHFPQFPIPKEHLPIEALENDVMLMSKMSPLGYPSEKVDLVIFGHTHDPIAYFDSKIKTPVINSGSLSVARMSELNRSYALVSLKDLTVDIKSAAGVSTKFVRFPGGKAPGPGIGAPSSGRTGSFASDPCSLSTGEALLKMVK